MQKRQNAIKAFKTTGVWPKTIKLSEESFVESFKTAPPATAGAPPVQYQSNTLGEGSDNNDNTVQVQDVDIIEQGTFNDINNIQEPLTNPTGGIGKMEVNKKTFLKFQDCSRKYYQKC